MNGPSGPTDKKIRKNSESSGVRRPELRYLGIGKVNRAHGLQGEISVIVLTEFPDRFATTEWVYLGTEFEAEAYRLESYRWHKDKILLTLAGVTNRTQAEQLRGQFVQVPLAEAMPLPEDSYYHYQLIGLQVITTTDQILGPLVNILETGANDVYVVDHAGQELLLPAIPDVVQSIDLNQGQIVVKLLEGLI